MQDIIQLLPFATLSLTAPFIYLWGRAFVRLEFGRWLSSLRLLAVGVLLSGLATVLLCPELGARLVGYGALASSLLFFAIQSISAQPKRPARVAVGKAHIPFSAIDSEGGQFSSRVLAGRPYLLKFYRGHWCPYCRLELSAWENMSGELSARGLAMVAVSPDTPEELRRFAESRREDVIRYLSDAQMRVIDDYGLRSHRTLALGVGRSVARPLAIPTTVLIDAQGVVRWIDRSPDHQVRSDPARVLPAIDAALNMEAPHTPDGSAMGTHPRPCGECV